MSRRRVYNDDTKAIMERFFAALDMVLQNKLAKNLTTYCDEHKVDRRHLYAQRKDPDRGFFEVGWLVPLINNYGVSSSWLLTGKGVMFVQ